MSRQTAVDGYDLLTLPELTAFCKRFGIQVRGLSVTLYMRVGELVPGSNPPVDGMQAFNSLEGVALCAALGIDRIPPTKGVCISIREGAQPTVVHEYVLTTAREPRPMLADEAMTEPGAATLPGDPAIRDSGRSTRKYVAGPSVIHVERPSPSPRDQSGVETIVWGEMTGPIAVEYARDALGFPEEEVGPIIVVEGTSRG